jgi:hypothetical protein
MVDQSYLPLSDCYGHGLPIGYYRVDDGSEQFDPTYFCAHRSEFPTAISKVEPAVLELNGAGVARENQFARSAQRKFTAPSRD